MYSLFMFSLTFRCFAMIEKKKKKIYIHLAAVITIECENKIITKLAIQI